MKCPYCDGRGFINLPNWTVCGIENQTCLRCGGSGNIPFENHLEIPAPKPSAVHRMELAVNDLRARLAECEQEKSTIESTMLTMSERLAECERERDMWRDNVAANGLRIAEVQSRLDRLIEGVDNVCGYCVKTHKMDVYQLLDNLIRAAKGD